MHCLRNRDEDYNSKSDPEDADNSQRLMGRNVALCEPCKCRFPFFVVPAAFGGSREMKDNLRAHRAKGLVKFFERQGHHASDISAANGVVRRCSGDLLISDLAYALPRPPFRDASNTGASDQIT